MQKLNTLEVEHAECNNIHTSRNNKINSLNTSLKRAQKDLTI